MKVTINRINTSRECRSVVGVENVSILPNSNLITLIFDKKESCLMAKLHLTTYGYEPNEYREDGLGLMISLDNSQVSVSD